MPSTPSSVLAALALSLGVAPSAEAVQYRADLRLDGTWSESVRAGLDEADADGDGREEVAVRDQELAFTVTSSVPLTFRGGRLARRAVGTGHAFPSLTVARSSLVEPNGEAGACHVHEPGTGGAAEVAAAPGGFVFRPADDVIFQMVCRTERLEWGFAMDAMRLGGALGEAPLDASFALAPHEVGTQRIVRAVAASELQRSAGRCPREDPGHTVACSFGWDGEVVLERVDASPDAARAPRLRGRTASVEVVCRAACSPLLSVGTTRLRVAAPAGTSRVSLPLRSTPRRGARLKVRLGARTRSFVLR